MKIEPYFEYKGCSLELSPEEAQHLSMICLHYNRSSKLKQLDPRFNFSVKVMQGLDRAGYIPENTSSEKDE